MAGWTANQIAWLIIAIIIIIIVIYFYTMRKPLPPSEGKIVTSETAPPSTETLDMLDSNSEPQFILYAFHSPTCGACKRFAPNWDKASDYIKENLSPLVDARALNAADPNNDDIFFYYNIDAYPTVILSTPKYNVVYNGNRTPEDLIRFVRENLAKYSN